MGSHDEYSVFEYLYRDAANWKSWGNELLSGGICDADVARIEGKLESGQFFIPEQIGFKSLVDGSMACSSNTSRDAHVWHEFVGVRPATFDEVSSLALWGTTFQLLQLFDRVAKWEIERSPKFSLQYFDFSLRHSRGQPF